MAPGKDNSYRSFPLKVVEADLIKEGTFDPSIHLNFKEPARIYNMQDIGLPLDTGVTPFAVTEPFSLFTEEAVHRMRAEILTDKVFENCKYSSNLSQCQLRGFASE